MANNILPQAVMLAANAYNDTPTPGWDPLKDNSAAPDLFLSGLMKSSNGVNFTYANGFYEAASTVLTPEPPFIATSHDDAGLAIAQVPDLGHTFTATSSTLNTLAISFRGTDEGATDLSNPIPNHYADFSPLVDEVVKLTTQADVSGRGPIGQILVTGHSLGGAMVQDFLLDPRIQALHAPIFGFTFGSPGADRADAGALASHPNEHLLNFANTDDPIAQTQQLFPDTAAFEGITGRVGTNVFLEQPDETPADIAPFKGQDLLALFAAVPEVGVAPLSEHEIPLYATKVTQFADTQSIEDLLAIGRDVTYALGTNGNDVLGGTQSGPNTPPGTVEYSLKDAPHDIFGLAGNDTLIGTNADDILSGGAGNDTLDGKAGINTAIYDGNSTDYSIAINPDHTTVIQDKRPGSPDGTDTLANIELLRFQDKVMVVPAQGQTGVTAEVRNHGAVLESGSHPQTLVGTDKDDDFILGAGDTTVFAGHGSDTIFNGAGNDQLYLHTIGASQNQPPSSVPEQDTVVLQLKGNNASRIGHDQIFGFTTKDHLLFVDSAEPTHVLNVDQLASATNFTQIAPLEYAVAWTNGTGALNLHVTPEPGDPDLLHLHSLQDFASHFHVDFV